VRFWRRMMPSKTRLHLCVPAGFLHADNLSVLKTRATYGYRVNRILALATALVLTLSAACSPAVAEGSATVAKTATGALGQVLTIDQFSNLADGQVITVTGKGYDLKTGIYVTFCVIPAKGKRPELCGPFDITGKNNQSVWVSSNPPIYAVTLVTPFTRITKKLNFQKVTTGSFRVQVPATRMIGTYDCKVVKCAILTRADHTQSDNRKADVIIPVTFK
jgi:hypothetical protein